MRPYAILWAAVAVAAFAAGVLAAWTVLFQSPSPVAWVACILVWGSCGGLIRLAFRKMRGK